LNRGCEPARNADRRRWRWHKESSLAVSRGLRGAHIDDAVY